MKAATWKVETALSDPYAFYMLARPEVAIGPNDDTHLIGWQFLPSASPTTIAASTTLLYLHKVGSTWTTSTILPPNTSYDTSTAMVVDNDGTVYVAFGVPAGDGTQTLQLAHKKSSEVTWTIETILTTTNQARATFLDLAIGHDGSQYLGFSTFSFNQPINVQYLHRARNGAWSTPELVTDSGVFQSIAVDRHGHPVIIYGADLPVQPPVGNGAMMEFASRNNDGTWSAETVVTTEPIQPAFGIAELNGPKVALDDDGHPFIMYLEETTDFSDANTDGQQLTRVTFAARSGSGTWKTEPVDTFESFGNIDFNGTLVIGHDGIPRTTYSKDLALNFDGDPTDPGQRYAYRSGGKWHIEIIPDNGQGGHGALALDSCDHARVAYTGANDGLLNDDAIRFATRF